MIFPLVHPPLMESGTFPSGWKREKMTWRTTLRTVMTNLICKQMASFQPYPGDPRRTVQGTPLAVYKGRLDTYEIVMSHFCIIYSKKDDVQVCKSHTSTDGL